MCACVFGWFVILCSLTSNNWIYATEVVLFKRVSMMMRRLHNLD